MKSLNSRKLVSLSVSPPPSFPYFFFSFFLSSSLLFVFQLLFFTVTLLFVPVLNGSVPKVVNPTNSTHFRFATIGAVDAEWRRRLNPNPIQNEDTANIKLMIIRRWQSEGEDCYPQRYDAIERSPSSIQPSLFLPLCFNRIKLYAIGREVRDEEVEERELGKGEGGGRERGNFFLHPSYSWKSLGCFGDCSWIKVGAKDAANQCARSILNYSTLWRENDSNIWLGRFRVPFNSHILGPLTNSLNTYTPRQNSLPEIDWPNSDQSLERHTHRIIQNEWNLPFINSTRVSILFSDRFYI